jgi:large subunit ribosomal protein L18e
MKSYIEKNQINEWLAKLDDIISKEPKRKGFAEEIKKFASMPRRKRIKVNIRKLDKLAKEGDHIIVPGKVLGIGEVSKKFNISAIEFSQSAIEKLKKGGCNIISIDDAFKAKDARIII